MPGQPDSRYDVFLSFAEGDRDWVEGYLLPSLGLPKERVIASQQTKHSESFQLGAPVVNEFERAVTSSRYTLLVLSRAYLADQWSTFGEQLASYAAVAEQRNRLIPLLRERDCSLPLHIEFRVRLDCTEQDRWEPEIARLLELLAQPEPNAERIPCPYPGMIPFSEKDARFFYGREDEIRQMLQHFRNQTLLYVIGPSGCGKSSLVCAGVLPRLQTSGLFEDGFWLVRQMRPGPHPVRELCTVLGGDPNRESVAKLLAANPPAQRLLLTVDQFEELFSQAERSEQSRLSSEQSRFITAVKGLCAVESCALLIAMRADFYPELMNSDLWGEVASHRMEIAPLRGEALREAIEKPAGDVGVYLERGLADRLVNDAAEEPGALPLLQETMQLLWAEMTRRFLPLRAYEQLGKQSRSGLVVAIAKKADASLNELSSEQQVIARRIFLRLVQFGEGRPDTRRQQPVSSLRAERDDPHEFERTLRHLEDNRLVTVTGEERGREKKVDLAHEALITGWPRLQEWLQQRRIAEQTRRRLESKAEEWMRLERKGGLLDEVEIKEAEQWLQGPDAIDLGGPSSALMDLLRASTKAIEERNTQEEEARQRELEQARSAAVRFRWFSFGLAVVLLIAIGAAWYARQEQLVTESQSLAVQARDMMSRDRPEALNLAIMAWKKAHTLEANSAVAMSYPQLLVTLQGHGGSVSSAVFSADGQRIVTASQDDHTAKVWNATSGQFLATLMGHDSPVYSAEFSPDAQRIVTASDDGTAKVWNAATGQLLATLEGHGGTVNSAVFSPDGQEIVTASDDKTAKVWDTATGQLLKTLQGHSDSVSRAMFSPNGQRIVTASEDYTAKLWNAANGQLLASLGHRGIVHGARFSPNGLEIVTGSDDKTAKVWNAGSGQLLAMLEGHSDSVNTAEFSPDGQRIVTASDDGTAKVWNAATGQLLKTLQGHSDGDTVWSAVFSPDGQWIVTASGDHTAKVWNAATGQLLATLEGHDGPVYGAVFSANGQRILTASGDQTAKVWNPENWQLLAKLRGHDDDVNSAVFSPDGLEIVTAGDDKTAKVWNVTTGQLLKSLQGHDDRVNSAVFSPDGLEIVTAGDDNTAKVWNVPTGQLLKTLQGHDDSVNTAVFSPDGLEIVTAGDDNTAKVWNAGSGQLLATLQGHNEAVNNAVFSADGRWVATASKDHTAKVWNAANGQLLATLEGHSGDVLSAVFSIDGRWVATASKDHTAKVWNAANGQLLATLEGHFGDVLSAVFSIDGRWVATASKDHTAKVWNAANGQLLATLQGHGEAVNSAVFSADGRWVATASEDHTAKVWNAANGQLFASLGHGGIVHTARFSANGLNIVTASEDHTPRVFRIVTLFNIADLLSK